MVASFLFVPATKIIREALKDRPATCLDLERGLIVRTDGCARRLIGEGRPAVQNGLHFIKIPSLVEASFELVSHMVPPPDRKPLRHKRHFDPQYALAASIVSKNWLRSLQLPLAVEWLDLDHETLLRLDPGSGTWKRMPRRSTSTKAQ